MIVIACALKAELAAIVRLGTFRSGWRRLGTGPGAARYKKGDIHGVDAALVVSGMGEDTAYTAAKRALAAFRPRAYISAGFSGALMDSLRPGDLVIGESAASPARGRAASYKADTALVKAARDGLQGLAFVSGSVVTVPRTLVTAAEKRDYTLLGGWLAADMESAGSARAAYEDGVPFIAIRAISDALAYDMPVDFNRFINHGRLHYPRFLLHVLTHPGTIKPLMHLGRNSRLAAEKLAEALVRVAKNI